MRQRSLSLVNSQEHLAVLWIGDLSVEIAGGSRQRGRNMGAEPTSKPRGCGKRHPMLCHVAMHGKVTRHGRRKHRKLGRKRTSPSPFHQSSRHDAVANGRVISRPPCPPPGVSAVDRGRRTMANYLILRLPPWRFGRPTRDMLQQQLWRAATVEGAVGRRCSGRRGEPASSCT